ncbi:glycogen synthase [Olleya sp. ITB9]|uniref:glycogen synthase n=1 Tax=Olleya sp. ITB9 TaxID=1715648 RepID=UPI0006D2A4BE|nr:glycogen synthase [Olleya sp. ITB9]
MKIIHISAECYPIAKVGGLADVVGALPKYQNALGHPSSVIMPFYDNKYTQEHTFEKVYEAEFNLGPNYYVFSVLKTKDSDLDIEAYFIDIPELLYKNYVYSVDDTKRFIAFQIAALDWIKVHKQQPGIIHCHDHHTGLIPFMLQECFDYQVLNTIPVITTIHNAQYQGWFGYDKLHLIPDFNEEKIGLLDWNGCINPLAAAIKCAWRVTTVSPSYMEELKQNANGLESLLSHESTKCQGILNGIDTQVWNPETDDFIIENFTKDTISTGRKANKNWLCKEYNLDPNKPLFGFIGRLVSEKGVEIFPDVFKNVLETEAVSILLLGSGEKETENALKSLKPVYNGKYNAYIGYDERLSHIIYAGTDFLLMPSKVEPCGLNQMYALRYGAIPIVRRIGGLKDTVIDIDQDGFGICHDDVSVYEVEYAIKRAVALYNDSKRFKKLQKQIMTIDHSWDVSAKAYINLYQSIN